MAKKKGHTPEEIVAKLRQVDVLVSYAIRLIGSATWRTPVVGGGR